ncbi:hypothetical protein [Actinomadura atramentaria]|uniref:hypothetical protein n=1 Tax=Actinomadura atramentaria TaxID=1990 RepID=UPI00038023EB|nr:hypothetical protein [Actinomadura atramentaria]
MRTARGEIGAALRQWTRPPEFRIRRTPWPAEALAALADLARAAEAERAATAGRADAVDPPPAAEPAQGLPASSAADLATSLWRLRTRVAADPDAPRAVVRHADTAWDALADAGVEVKDHLGDPFDPGLSLTVVAFQPTPGLAREQVIETIRPSVYLHGETLQTAEVIVGTPDESEEQEAAAEETHNR